MESYFFNISFMYTKGMHMMKKSFILLNLMTAVFVYSNQSTQELDQFEYHSLEERFEEVYLPSGRHVIADLDGCQQCYYTDEIESILREAAHRASATILDIKIFKFPEILVDGKIVQGMTGVVILSESHIAFHTWPENGFVACDIFTCGANTLPEKGLEVLCDYFKPTVKNIKIIGRGLANTGE